MRYYIDEKEVDYDGEFLPALNSFQYRITEQGSDFVRLSYGNPEFEIHELKKKLFGTDYKAIKYAEGYISEEEYAPIKAQRQAWRDEINALQEKQREMK